MTLVLEPKNEADYRLFVELAKRLHVTYRETPDLSEEELIRSENSFFALAGSWQGEETTDELIRLIESARTSKEINLSL